jgi:hypothetical protein
MKIVQITCALCLMFLSANSFAKLPPPPPVDPVAAAAKAEKDKIAAEKAKVQQATAEDKAVKSFQAAMKKAGKPIPKPTPIVVAAAPPPAAPAKGAAPPAKTPPAKK